jgi:predicted porin
MSKGMVTAAIVAAFMVQGAVAQKKPEADSSVTLYGKVYPWLQWPSGSGATPAGAQTCTICGTPAGNGSIIERTELESGSSRFGIRGHERLGRGLRAIYQLETEFHLDQNDSAFATRDSFVGLRSDAFGTVKLGRHDTPFKDVGTLGFLGVSGGSFTHMQRVLRRTGFGTQGASSFHLRRPNMVQYESPSFGGLEVWLQWSTNEATTASRDPEVRSGAMTYSKGPLYLALAYEEHDDLFGGSRNARSAQSNFANQGVNSKDRAVQATAQYRLGKVHTLHLEYIRKEYKESGSIPVGNFKSYENDAWGVVWRARWNPQWTTQAYYIRADDGSCSLVGAGCRTDGLASTHVTVGASYHFSRQTYLFLIGSVLRNGDSARYAIVGQVPSIGEDVRVFALGIHTTF